MPNWHDILGEIKESGSTHDVIRRKYIKKLFDYTNRNVIVYYSGWLQKEDVYGTHVNDADKNGFMTVINKLDKSLGLDLILHTPGGDTAATESIVDYLKGIFGKNIRAIVPQLAMSAGTMIACSCKEIVMGLHSSLGPIDPQFNGIPAHGIVEEFDVAHNEIQQYGVSKIAIWQPIIAKYSPTLIGECKKAIEWSEEMVKEWLLGNMLYDDPNKTTTVQKIIHELGNHSVSKSHARHLATAKCKDIGLNIFDLESDPELQDIVLSIHHSCIHTLSSTNAFKIIENQNGIAFIQSVQNIMIPR